MLVERITGAGSSHVSYVIACPDTGAAAVIDPDPSRWAACTALAARLRLSIVLLLSTEPCLQTDCAEGERIGSLLSDLSRIFDEPAKPHDAKRAERAIEVPDGAMWVRPCPPKPRAASVDVSSQPLTLLRFGNRLAILHAFLSDAAEGPVFDGDPKGTMPAAGGYRSAKVSLGRLSVDVLAVSELGPRLAFVVAGCVFSGRALYRGSAGWVTDCTDERLLTLPGDVCVFPGEVCSAVGVATIAEEVEARALRQLAPTPVAGFPDFEFGDWNDHNSPISLVGRLASAGYRDVEPSEVLPILSGVRVVELRLARELEPGIPGAQRVLPSQWAADSRDWDRRQPVLVVSSTGLRCASFATALVRDGFVTVYRLVGGLAMWADSGLPLEDSVSEYEGPVERLLAME